MALISCPECNKEISDKSNACIHCGYPITSEINTKELSNYIKSIKGKNYDLRKVAELMLKKEKIYAIKELRNMTGLGLAEAKEYVESMDLDIYKNLSDSLSTNNAVFAHLKCPLCNSTNIESITGFKKGASALAFGVFAANTVLSKYKCKSCGHKF